MTGKKPDFFSALRSKLLREPSRAADRAFWRKFESEFDRSGRGWLSWHRLAPVAAMLVMSVGGYWIWERQRERELIEDRSIGIAMSTHEEMFEELDMFAEFAGDFGDELPVEDADWSELEQGAG